MTPLSGTCPICDASCRLPQNTEESEIITCMECKSKLVVEAIQNTKVTLAQAPAVEEDWGQ